MRLPTDIRAEGQFHTSPSTCFAYWQAVVGGQHSGMFPPPSAIAVVADMASRMPATRMIRTIVFFIMLLLSGFQKLDARSIKPLAITSVRKRFSMKMAGASLPAPAIFYPYFGQPGSVLLVR